ncbi:MAG: V-type ATPase subunit [Nitrososphaerota archaeon]|jgi:V/A-type H+-transporting ATPase subunit C|nr:V-type ATPase subunit [Nitrososphaerota archaeon]
MMNLLAFGDGQALRRKKNVQLVNEYLALHKRFLSRNFMNELNMMEDSAQIEEALSTTWYKYDIEAASSLYRPPVSIDVALNRRLVEINRLGLEVVPDHGRNALKAFLSKWDIEDILLILAAKSLGRKLEETEPFIVSPRNLPIGIAGNVIPFSHLKLMMEQKDLESVIKELVRYRYGAILLQHMGDFERTGDIGVFEAALFNDYYTRLLWELRFYKGDEGALREYFMAEITKRNVLTILKARDSPIDKDTIAKHLLYGGFGSLQTFIAACDSPDLSTLASSLREWIDIAPAIKRFKDSGNIAEFEVEIDNIMIDNYFWRFRMHPLLSVTDVFMFLLKAQYERENIRRIVYGREYRLPVMYINSILLKE